MKNLLVQDWMTRSVITISPDTTVPDAAALMRENKIRRLPVVDSQQILLGILSYSDVLEAQPSNATSLDVWEINYLLTKLHVEKVMAHDPLTVSPDTTIKEAAQIMHDNKIGGLPVIDEERRVVGIITESDIFRILIAWFNNSSEQEHSETASAA